MKHFRKPDGSIWAFELDGSQDDLIQDGMTAISEQDLLALRRPQRADLVAQTLAAARQVRMPIMGVLDGMQASALTLGDSAAALAIETAKQGLRDITKVDLSGLDAQDQMAAAVYGRYVAIAGAVPLALRTAFAEVLQ